MTTHKATGTKFFISSDPLPENPTDDDFKALDFVEIGGITEPPVIEFTYTALKTRAIKRRGTYSYVIGKIKKPKLWRFGRIIKVKRET
jgi:hypothetical protein